MNATIWQGETTYLPAEFRKTQELEETATRGYCIEVSNGRDIWTEEFFFCDEELVDGYSDRVQGVVA